MLSSFNPFFTNRFKITNRFRFSSLPTKSSDLSLILSPSSVLAPPRPSRTRSPPLTAAAPPAPARAGRRGGSKIGGVVTRGGEDNIVENNMYCFIHFLFLICFNPSFFLGLNTPILDSFLFGVIHFQNLILKYTTTLHLF